MVIDRAGSIPVKPTMQEDDQPHEYQITVTVNVYGGYPTQEELDELVDYLGRDGYCANVERVELYKC